MFQFSKDFFVKFCYKATRRSASSGNHTKKFRKSQNNNFIDKLNMLDRNIQRLPQK